MKLSASINFYNAEELLIQAVRCIRPLVEHLSIVYQETSNWGNVISERAKKVIEQLKSEGLVDDFYCYEPNSSFNASENEFQKRQIGLDLAKTAGASHFLLMDADEFYIPKQFLKVKEIIRTSDISYSCVRSYFYIHQSIYRSELPDTTNVCFIAKITPELSFEYQGAFPAENVDPTRRLVNSSGRFKFFDANDICMHHMNFVRESFKSKLVNTSSAANPDFIRKAKNALNDWRWPNDFVFPNKPKYKIVEVEDVFQLQKIKYVYQAQPKKKVLLTNYFIREFSGSEMAIFDLAREFLKRGYDVTIGAFIFSDPLLSEFASLGVTLLDLNNASTEHFSLIWAQHFITLDTCLIDSGITADKIIYSSLSPYESLESPPASVKYVNLFLANSSETKNVLVSMGLDECDVIIFPNPVNQSFFSKKKINSQGLKRLAIVSNHIPTEIEQVAEQLRQKGVEVKEFGMLHEFVLITPEVLNNFDAVITIGRTVQYCLAMGIPIYCYDRFGGPGWINIDNIDRAALYNFSGRCVGTKKQADDIESELINNFETTQTQAKFYEEYAKLHFDLENQLDRVLGSLISGQKTDIEQCPKTVLNIINRQRKFTQDLIRNILHNNHIISEKDHIISEKDHILVTKDYQLHAQSQQHHKYKKLWTTRLLKPLIKTEQALSSANKIRKGFRRLIQEKGSLGKAYQFVRRMRKQEGIKAVKNLLRDQSLLSSVKQLEPIKFSVDETQEIVILTTKHTRFVAELIHSALIKIDIRSKILESEPDWYSDGWHIVICPQIFKKLPKHYVAFQMEQSVSSRWFNLEYFNRLNGAESIFDYSIKNIDFLQQNGIHYKKIFYMPIGTLKSTILSQTTENFEYDVLFYGDANNNRRQRYLEELSKRFRVKIVSELFGENLRDLLIKAKVIVNIHYYENALLETTRIYECLSLNKLVVSESSSDLCEHDVLSGVVDFVEIDNIHQMIERIEFWLHHENEFTKRLTEVAQFQKNCQQFEFYFYRFLLAKDVISFDQFYDLAKQHVQPDNDFWCLGLPETVSRAQSFKKDNQYGITVIPALRHQLGWIGCGLSYKFMIRMAKDLKLQMVTICEDDVEFKNDSIPRYQHIMSVLSQTTKPWSVFSGLIADMSPETIISESGIYMEEEKIYKTSKFVSTVFNVYKETVFSSILEWDERDLTWPGNTFDRFLEHHHDIEALVVTPFLVGHKEEIESTLWGHGNEKYKPMIEKSQKILDSKIILLGR